LAPADDDRPVVDGLAAALDVDDTVDVRVFAKPDARPSRRMGVALAAGANIEEARQRAQAAAAALRIGKADE
jgi:phosphoribosylglycinamide formyltransferase 2